MNRTISMARGLAVAFALLISVDCLAQETPSNDVPRVISYQGVLTSNDGKNVRDGAYPVTITLYADEAGTKAVWHDTYTTQVQGGVFSVELGSGNVLLPTTTAMNTPLWVGLRLADGTEMRPLTRMTSAPYALNVADNSITTAKIAAGAVTSDKLGIDYVSEVQVNGEKVSGQGTPLNFIGSGVDFDRATGSVIIGTSSGETSSMKEGATTAGFGDQYWSIIGDARTEGGVGITYPAATDWIGTSDPPGAPTGNNFTIRVNGETIMRYQPNAANTPNVVGGHLANTVAAATIGATIAGGGNAGAAANLIQNSSDYATIGGGADNLIGPGTRFVQYGVIAGGENNTLGNTTSNVTHSAIVGGEDNEARVNHNFIGGGLGNVTQGQGSAIVGGESHNTGASAEDAFIGGGQDNDATGSWSTIAGGRDHTAQGTRSAILGGQNNDAAADYSTVGGGENNTASSDWAVVAGGVGNTASGVYSGVGGGSSNTAQGNGSFVGAGRGNQALGVESAIAGGLDNITTSTYGGVLAGQKNQAADYSAVGAGWQNLADGSHAFIGAGATNNIDAATDYSAIAGGLGNQIFTNEGAIGGGSGNIINNAGLPTDGGVNAAIPGGDNLIAQSYGQIVAGFYNRAQGTMPWRPTGPAIAASDDRLFILGNGDANTLPTPTRSNAFEVSYNGHSIVYDRNGQTSIVGGRQPIKGATYTDNVLNAWGHIAAGGAIVSDFGVLKTVVIGAGVVRVVIRVVDPVTGLSLPMNLNGASITATIVEDEFAPHPPCRTISTSPLVQWFDPMTGILEPNTFVIRTKEWSTAGCDEKDIPFMFKVSGRP